MVSKLLTPVLASLITGFVGFTAGVYKVSNRPLEVKTACPKPVCPEFKCPEGNSIDFDKMKNFRGTLSITQKYYITANGDSLYTRKMVRDIVEAQTITLRKELERVKLVKCK